jgi:hypothetical protein
MKLKLQNSDDIKTAADLFSDYRLVWAKKVSLAAICLVAGSASFGLREN